MAKVKGTGKATEGSPKQETARARMVPLEPLPDEIARRERQGVKVRRSMADIPPELPQMGVAVSGGGIRSATFALGFFQSLARADLLKRIDYLSTVSGGGYFGSFLGALFVRENSSDRHKTPAAVNQTLAASDSPAIRYLRDNGAYLAPGGSSDLMLGGAVLLRNWLALQFVILSLVLLLFVATHTIELWLFLQSSELRDNLSVLSGSLHEYGIYLSPWIVFPLGLLCFFALPLGASYWTIGRDRVSKHFHASLGAVWMALPHLSVVGASLLAVWSGVLGDGILSVGAVGVACIAVLSLVTASVAAARPWWVLWLPYGFGLLGILVTALGPVPRPADFESISVFHALPFVALLLAFAKLGFASEEHDELSADSFARHRVSTGLRSILVLSGASLALSVVDSVGRTLYLALTDDWSIVMGVSGGFSGLVLFISAFGRKIALRSAEDAAKKSVPSSVALWLAALTLVALISIGASFGSQALLWSAGPPKIAPTEVPGEPEVARHKVFEVPGSDSPQVELLLQTTTKAVLPAPGALHLELNQEDFERAALLFAALLSICLLLGSSRAFLNRSTHLPLYSSRLTRAYLGASNPKRQNPRENPDEHEPDPQAATCVMAGDDISSGSYFGWGWDGNDDAPPGAHFASGAPLHIINVTINETVDGKSQITSESRRGLGLAIGPCALSAGVRHHLIPGAAPALADDLGQADAHRVFTLEDDGKATTYPEEPLTLGQWMSISGAAFSTGLGERTSTASSLLAGFANVRLGYWWRPGVDWKPTLRRLFGSVIWVQTYLLREFFARFPGTQNSLWYLSDGGHFENMGGYELIRRRLPFLIVLDAEADSKYQFEGLGNFVRKARLDFGAEIEFIDSPLQEIEEQESAEPKSDGPSLPLGPLSHLRRGEWKPESAGDGESTHFSFEARETGGSSRVRAALAKVRYADESEDAPPRFLLYVKPVLLPDLPTDLLHYSSKHDAFPHEPTVDQFFDEAQWESYRKLGEISGAELFPQKATGRHAWLSNMMRGTHRLMRPFAASQADNPTE